MDKQFTLGVFALLLVCFGCNSSDSNHLTSRKVLKEVPFKAITDSIDQFPKDPDLYIKRAHLLIQKKYSELAVEDYKKAWELRPDEITALYYTASLFMSGKEKDAVDLLKECIKKYPDNMEFPRRLSEAYLQSGKPREALHQYELLLQKDPENFEALYEKGRLQATLKDTAGAIASLEQAYALQPLQLFGVALANLYAETKNPKVVPLCDELISKDQEQQVTDPIYLKGVYFANINQRAAALQQFELCIRRDWKFTEAYIEKGIILFDESDYDEALKTFSMATTVTNTYPDAYYWMGRCYEAKGKKQDAIDNYYKALTLDRNFPQAREALRRVSG